MDNILKSLSEILMNSTWLAPFLAFIAGILTSFTPCSLSSLPLIVGFVTGSGEKSTKTAFRYSLLFALGSGITFTILGTIASLAGNLIGASSSWWYVFLGILMMLMALQTWGIYQIIPSSYLISKNTKQGYIGALIAGILGGIFSSPCSTPMLVALMAVVAGSGNLPWGIVLLLFYSIGHGVLSVICGTSIGLVQKITRSEKYGKLSKFLNIIMGLLIALIGFYMFYLGF